MEKEDSITKEFFNEYKKLCKKYNRDFFKKDRTNKVFIEKRIK